MKTMNSKWLLCNTICFSLLLLCSCEETLVRDLTNDQLTYYQSSFEGNIIEFLGSDGNSGDYDSLLMVLDQIPELRNLLESDTVSLTFFAVKNQSFSYVINELNKIRVGEGLEPNYITDLDNNDLDTLLRVYLFDQVYDSHGVKPNTNGLELESLSYGYKMHLIYDQLSASGIEEMGVRRLIFSDPRNTALQTNWERSISTEFDIEVSNGIIHVLEPGHNFGFSSFIFRFGKYVY